MKTTFQRLPDERVKMTGILEGTIESNTYSGLIDVVIDRKESKNIIDFKILVNNELNYHISHYNYGEKSIMTTNFGELFRNLYEMTIIRSFKIDDESLRVLLVKTIDGEKVSETSELYRGSINEKSRSSFLIDINNLERAQSNIQVFSSEVSTYYIDPMMVDMTDAMIAEITKTIHGSSNDLLDQVQCQIDCALEYLSDTWDCLKKGEIFKGCQEDAVRTYDNCLSRCS